LDWEAAGPYLARRVGREEGKAPRAFVHCDKRLVGGRIGLREGLGVLAHLNAARVAATSSLPDPGWGAPGVSSPLQRERTRGTAKRPVARGSAVRMTAREDASPAGRSGLPTITPPGIPSSPALGARQSLSWVFVTPRRAQALAATSQSASGALRAAHVEAIVDSLVDTLAWAARGAGAVLRDSSSPRTALSEQILVDTTPEAIGYQMTSQLERHGQRVASGPKGPSARGGYSRALYARELARSAAPYHEGSYTASAEGFAAAGAAPSRAPPSSWGPCPEDRGSAQEYPVDPSVYDHYGGYARDDCPHSPGRE